MTSRSASRSALPAIAGGTPVRATLLPYGRQTIDAADEAAVLAALRSDYLTTGPRVAEFEAAIAKVAGVNHAIAVNSGTAALHAALQAVGVRPGDEVIVPAMTFVASANAALYLGAVPVFADVDAGSLLIDPADVEARITPRTRAVIAVDYQGQPCDYAALRAICARRGIALIADACHSLGGRAADGRTVGALADVTCLSTHPVKIITTGEGGVVVTHDSAVAERARAFRTHGISRDHRQRQEAFSYRYDMSALGFNYRLSDLACALGTEQLKRLSAFVEKRRSLAERYDRAFAGLAAVEPLRVTLDQSAYHLYVVQLRLDALRVDRDEFFRAMRAENIGVNVHYIPVHYHSYYREHLGTREGMLPRTEAAFERILTLPLFPMMQAGDVDDVVEAVARLAQHYAR